jgi:predicted HTH domain antitoxin
MSLKSFTAALTLYQSQTLTLEQAATHAGVTVSKFETALQARGIPVRETARDRASAQTAK